MVSACPTGIAHTYMAADKLSAAGEAAGVDVHVETQGSSGATPLDPAVIRAADAVIFAVDVGVRDQDRFAGKPVVQSGTKRAINEPDVMIREALAAADDPNARRVAGTAVGGRRRRLGRRQAPSTGTEIRRWLLTGVSYMIPFVAAGGLLIALGFLLAGYPIVTRPTRTSTARAMRSSWVLEQLPVRPADQHRHRGTARRAARLPRRRLLRPRPGRLRLPRPGAGRLHRLRDRRPARASRPASSSARSPSTVGAGFLGGLIGGIIAGLAALWISRWKLPAGVRGLQPVVIIPLLATLISSGLMVIVLGRPLAAALTGLGDWLNGLTGTSAILLGILLGLMMCFDLGGPVNKAAYVFATAGLTAASPGRRRHQQLVIMATVMAAGMVPPLAMALSTTVRPKLYTPAERDNGKAAWLLGAVVHLRGRDPVRRGRPAAGHPVDDAGRRHHRRDRRRRRASRRGLRTAASFVFFAISNFLLWLLAIAIGAVVGGGGGHVAKGIGRTDAEDAPEDAVDLEHAHAPVGVAPASATTA